MSSPVCCLAAASSGKVNSNLGGGSGCTAASVDNLILPILARFL
jgi:hypothetical protein